jgi:hypothetical protein
MTFDFLRAKNLERCERFQPLDAWLPSQWSNAMAGECGETCNLTKKMDRMWPANQFKVNMNKTEDQRMEDLVAKAGLEIGDVIIYADLLASRLGLKLEDCVRQSFNDKSDVLKIDVRL